MYEGYLGALSTLLLDRRPRGRNKMGGAAKWGSTPCIQRLYGGE